MSFAGYSEYKDSGVEWLGEVPTHWELRKLKHIASFVGGGTPSRENLAYWNGEIPWVSPKDMKSERISGAEESITEDGLSNSTAVLIPPRRVLMVVRSGILNHTIPVAINDVPVALNQDMKALTFRAPYCSSEYFLRWVQGLNERLLRAWAKQGATVESIEYEYLANSIVALPSPDEQTAIVAFLDRETAKLDALVVEQQRLIELLKEKRQSVISQAVTKGLNPDVPMKSSGVDWMGEVPVHWDVCLLKRKFRSVDYGISDALSMEGKVAILRMGNIENGRVVTHDLKYTDDVDSSLLLDRGDLLYNRTNSLELIGKVGLFGGSSGLPVSFASYLVRLRVVDECLSEYFAYLLNSDGILGLARASAFVAIGQCNLNPSRYGQILVAVPPRSEQVSIAEYLDRETIKIDALTSEAQSAIKLLQERRAALISSAVTGQIDVRGLADKVAA